MAPTKTCAIVIVPKCDSNLYSAMITTEVIKLQSVTISLNEISRIVCIHRRQKKKIGEKKRPIEGNVLQTGKIDIHGSVRLLAHLTI